MSTTVASKHNPEAHNPQHVMNNKRNNPNVHARVWVQVSTQNELSTSLTCIDLEEGDAFYHTQNLLCNMVQEVKMHIANKSNFTQSQLHALSKRAISKPQQHMRGCSNQLITKVSE